MFCHVNHPRAHASYRILFLFPEIFCPGVLSFAHAQINDPSTSGQTEFVIGSSYWYTCDGDYRFIDGNQTGVIVCDLNGDWTGIDYDEDG